ncbi:hypothetical protein ACHAXT_004423 [Thalassiosira profunda]
MEQLTLTGATTVSNHSRTHLHATADAAPKAGSDASAAAHQGGSLSQPHNHNHNHGNAHDNCCPSHAPSRPAKVDASTLLPSKEIVNRFKSDKLFRLNVLSNVVRGGPYKLFVALLTVLVSEGEESTGNDAAGEEGRDDALLEGADPEFLANALDGHGADGHTLAHWCAKRGDEPRFLAFLIEKSHVSNGAKLLIDLHLPSKDAVGMYPLHWAVTEGAIPLVSMLLQHLEERPSPYTYERSLSTASSSSLMQSDNDHPSDGASVDPSNVGIDAQDSSGCTPLLIASQYGHPDLAAFLIRRGANPNAVDSSRDTALHWAAYKGSVEVCGMLLHLLGVEGKLDAQDLFGQTPLHLASLRGNAETVQFLMEEAGSMGESAGGAGGRVGSKNKSMRAGYPSKLLAMKDKEEKTPKDLAIKKKKLGCELLLQEYEEQYLQPNRSIFARAGRTCRDLFSVRNWKAWMGMGGSDMPIGQSPTFPFYWMTGNILLGGFVYATEFAGLGGKREDSLLLDTIGLHLFFVVSYFFTWVNLLYVYKTNPGVLDARGDGGSSSPATCQLVCCSSGYSRDKVSLEMDAVTTELRRQYDAIIESFSTDFPSQEKRVPLCHTCRIVKPLRSKHCRVARRCVLVFDHHCPFVGTTIGLYNYIYFYLFLLSFCLMEIGFVAAWILFLKRSKVFPKGAFLMGGYLGLYFVPVAFMAFYHTQLVLNNVTTNEQLNLRKYRYFWGENGRFRNPFNRGVIRNTLNRCWPDRSSYELGQPTRRSEVELTRQEEERRPMLAGAV